MIIPAELQIITNTLCLGLESEFMNGFIINISPHLYIVYRYFALYIVANWTIFCVSDRLDMQRRMQAYGRRWLKRQADMQKRAIKS